MSDEKKAIKKRAGISGTLDDVFAKKNAPAPIPEGSVSRKVDVSSKEAKRLPTSVKLPEYVDTQIRPWLDAHPEHNLGTMFLFALRAIGFDVNDEDLVPQRFRRMR